MSCVMSRLQLAGSGQVRLLAPLMNVSKELYTNKHEQTVHNHIDKELCLVGLQLSFKSCLLSIPSQPVSCQTRKIAGSMHAMLG